MMRPHRNGVLTSPLAGQYGMVESASPAHQGITRAFTSETFLFRQQSDHALVEGLKLRRGQLLDRPRLRQVRMDHLEQATGPRAHHANPVAQQTASRISWVTSIAV